MLQKNTSDYQKTIQRFKILFKSFRNSLTLFENCSLFEDDSVILKLWTNPQCIRKLIDLVCVKSLDQPQSKIKPQDLEQYKAYLNPCKIQFDTLGNEKGKSQGENNQKNNSFDEKYSSNHYQSKYEQSSFSVGQEMSTVKRQYKRGPYKNYTIQQKQQAVKMLMEDSYSVIQISRKLQIPCKNIKRWSQQGVFRKKGGGRKRFSPDTQKAVSMFLKQYYRQGSDVQYSQVQDIARRLSDDQAFKASRGWVVKFVQRQQLRNYFRFI